MSGRLQPSDWSRTVAVIGDTHFGSTTTPSTASSNGVRAERFQKIIDDLQGGLLMGTPLTVVHIGDQIEGLNTDLTVAPVQRSVGQPYFDQLAKLVMVMGDHDLSGSLTSEIPGWVAWANARPNKPGLVGSPVQMVDLGPFCVITGNYLNILADDQQVGTYLASTTKPCVVAIHRPPTGWMGNPSARFGTCSTVAMNNTAQFLGILDAHPNAKVLVHGHTHSPTDQPGYCRVQALPGGRRVLSVNTGANYYISGVTRGQWGDPLFTPFLTMTNTSGTGWEVRIRDHGRGAWIDFDVDCQPLRTATVD